jgi:ferredoxin
LFNKFSLWRIRRFEHPCTACAKYPRECLQHTKPETTDCIACGDCVIGCPTDGIKVRSAWEREKAG